MPCGQGVYFFNLNILFVLPENSFNRVENNKTPPLYPRNGVLVSSHMFPSYVRLKRLKEILIVYGQFTPVGLFVKDQTRVQGSGLARLCSVAGSKLRS